MYKKFLLLLIAVLTLCSLGCSKQNKNETLNLALEALKEPLRLMDQRYNLYTKALEAVRGYVEAPTETSLSTAKQICADAAAQLSALPVPQSSLSEQEEADMIDIGLNVADYKVPIEYEEYNRQQSIQNLTFLTYYLELAPTQDDLLEQIVSVFDEVNIAFRKVDYLCINELFCQFTGKEIDDFTKEFLPSLSALSIDGLPWETDSVVLEVKANTLMNDMDDALMLYAEFIGDQYEVLYQN
ncbi:MAG: hypothetical protein LBM69_06220 [Lachnospiraceae bacterium]|nr:hypothetical protein [Lachnospiraceae bacterium]